MKIAAIINKCAYNADQFDVVEFKKVAQTFGIDCDVSLLSPDEIAQSLQLLIPMNYETIIIGGGDGTVRTACQLMVGQSVPLAILPLGTFNHFAKTLKLPDNFEELLRLISQNKVKKIDLAQVNDIVFINNSSLGLYPHLVIRRDQYQDFFKKSKFLKTMLHIINIFQKLPLYEVKLKVHGKLISCQTCLIFVGNNYFELNIQAMGERKSLEEGLLSLYILKCRTRMDLLKLGFHILFNTFHKEAYINEYETLELSINVKRKQVHVAVDGEIVKLIPPLHYRILPKIINVISK